jgi:SAM-dependent methyltransferase
MTNAIKELLPFKIRAGLSRSIYLYEVIRNLLGVGKHQHRVICTLCGYTGKFYAFGHPPRYNAMCPVCNSRERHRLIALLNEREKLFADKSVLHFAPEQSVKSLIKRDCQQYLSADIDTRYADIALNIEKIDLPDNTWDVVVASHVLEHVNDKLALNEIFRILRPNGLLLVMVPVIEGWDNTYEDESINTPSLRELHFNQSDHLRLYGKDLLTRLSAAGFTVHTFTASGDESVKFGLLRGEKIFICYKLPAIVFAPQQPLNLVIHANVSLGSND